MTHALLRLIFVSSGLAFAGAGCSKAAPQAAPSSKPAEPASVADKPDDAPGWNERKGAPVVATALVAAARNDQPPQQDLWFMRGAAPARVDVQPPRVTRAPLEPQPIVQTGAFASPAQAAAVARPVRGGNWRRQACE